MFFVLCVNLITCTVPWLSVSESGRCQITGGKIQWIIKNGKFSAYKYNTYIYIIHLIFNFLLNLITTSTTNTIKLKYTSFGSRSPQLYCESLCACMSTSVQRMLYFEKALARNGIRYEFGMQCTKHSHTHTRSRVGTHRLNRTRKSVYVFEGVCLCKFCFAFIWNEKRRIYFW